jgi:hypothetical protein
MFTKLLQGRRKYLFLLIGVFIIFGLVDIFVFPQFFSPKVSPTENQVVTNEKKTPHVLTQKEKQQEVIELSKQLSKTVYAKDPRAAMAELHTMVSNDKNALANCHSLTHSIGDAALEKYKDVNTAMSYADEFCGSGYIHGVVETKIGNSTDLYKDLLSMCPKDSGNCYHGIGHGLMYYTSNDIPKALAYCDVFPDKQSQLFCSEGVFMENFNTDILSHSSIYLKKEDTTYPCAIQKEIYKGACYFYSSDYYLQLHPGDYQGAFLICDSVEPNYLQTCINGVGSRTMKRNILEPKLVESNCMKVREDYQNACVDGMVSYYIVNYYSLAKGRELCNQLEMKNKAQCEKSVAFRKDLFPE